MRAYLLLLPLAACSPPPATVAATPPGPPLAWPLRFELVAEATRTGGVYDWVLVAARSGILVVENREDGWSASTGGPTGPLRPVAAVDRAPFSMATWNVVPEGEVDGQLWFTGGPRNDSRTRHTVVVEGDRVSLRPPVYRLLPTPGGGALAFYTEPKEHFEAVGSAKVKPPEIPPGLLFHDLDITADGEIHGLGSRAENFRTLAGYVLPPNGKPRVFSLPRQGDYEIPATLVRGHPTFLGIAGFGTRPLTERPGRNSVPNLTYAGATPGGDIVYAAQGTSYEHPEFGLGWTRLDRATDPPTVPLPDAAALGAKICQDLRSVHQVVVTADGTVWLNGYCGKTADAKVLLRSVR